MYVPSGDWSKLTDKIVAPDGGCCSGTGLTVTGAVAASVAAGSGDVAGGSAGVADGEVGIADVAGNSGIVDGTITCGSVSLPQPVLINSTSVGQTFFMERTSNLLVEKAQPIYNDLAISLGQVPPGHV